MKHKPKTNQEENPALANITRSSEKVGLGGYLEKKPLRYLLKGLGDKLDRL